MMTQHAPMIHTHTPPTLATWVQDLARALYLGHRVIVMARTDGTLGDGGRIEQVRCVRDGSGKLVDELAGDWFLTATYVSATFGPDILAALRAGKVVIF